MSHGPAERYCTMLKSMQVADLVPFVTICILNVVGAGVPVTVNFASCSRLNIGDMVIQVVGSPSVSLPRSISLSVVARSLLTPQPIDKNGFRNN